MKPYPPALFETLAATLVYNFGKTAANAYQNVRGVTPINARTTVPIQPLRTTVTVSQTAAARQDIDDDDLNTTKGSV